MPLSLGMREGRAFSMEERGGAGEGAKTARPENKKVQDRERRSGEWKNAVVSKSLLHLDL
jgi:hypothetical protein